MPHLLSPTDANGRRLGDHARQPRCAARALPRWAHHLRAGGAAVNGPAAEAIRLTDVRFRYRGVQLRALNGVSLTVGQGEFLGIVGPSGAGKSTLALVMSGQIPAFVEGPFDGEALLFGRTTRGMRSADLAETAGMVYQDPEAQLYGLTVEEELVLGLENRCLPPDEIRRRVEWVLAVTGLHEVLEKSPYALSGGQKQRVVIAGVLALRPRILVLDEPTSALDPRGKTALYELLGNLSAEGVTVVIVEHDIERLVRHADRVCWLEAGRIAALGTPEEVFGRPAESGTGLLRMPQVAQLTHRLGLPAPWPITVDQAEAVLRPMLEATPR
ncbi:MAG: energy-coupling factor ABC transporter ATP-binding protein [Anaerolinea sp.]|nr:energy-coupling factor ABC transporter ATP-binding protein [Anaerolinea sp.]